MTQKKKMFWKKLPATKTDCELRAMSLERDSLQFGAILRAFACSRLEAFSSPALA
jgi:hypothetical protein